MPSAPSAAQRSDELHRVDAGTGGRAGERCSVDLDCGLEPQRLRVAGHLEIAAPDAPPARVLQIAQSFPVDGTGRTPAVEFLVVQQCLHPEDAGRRLDAPSGRVGRARARAGPGAFGVEAQLVWAEDA